MIVNLWCTHLHIIIAFFFLISRTRWRRWWLWQEIQQEGQGRLSPEEASLDDRQNRHPCRRPDCRRHRRRLVCSIIRRLGGQLVHINSTFKFLGHKLLLNTPPPKKNPPHIVNKIWILSYHTELFLSKLWIHVHVPVLYYI